jgi:hypothetical protein
MAPYLSVGGGDGKGRYCVLVYLLDIDGAGEGGDASCGRGVGVLDVPGDEVGDWLSTRHPGWIDRDILRVWEDGSLS